MRHRLVFRFELVATFIFRSLYTSNNNTVSIELEISGALFLPRGQYNINIYIYIYNSQFNSFLIL
jgi:hypothetical protein